MSAPSWLNESHVALITGATGTIGCEIALGLAKTKATVILAVRDVEKVRISCPIPARHFCLL